MGEIVNIRDRKRSDRGHTYRLERIKEELARYYDIDLDYLMASEPVSNLTIDQFENLTEGILSVIDDFLEEYPKVTLHDILYILENVKDIIRENTPSDEGA